GPSPGRPGPIRPGWHTRSPPGVTKDSSTARPAASPEPPSAALRWWLTLAPHRRSESAPAPPLRRPSVRARSRWPPAVVGRAGLGPILDGADHAADERGQPERPGVPA